MPSIGLASVLLVCWARTLQPGLPALARKPKIIGCVDTNPRQPNPTLLIVDAAAILLPSALTILAGALTSVTSTVEKSAMTRPPQQPPTQVFAQPRRSGCGTLLVALLVLAILTAIVIFLGAFGLLGWIFR